MFRWWRVRVSRLQISKVSTNSFVRSYSGYGKVGFDRRFRIFDISDYGETIRTHKRTEHDEILDEMILVGDGSAGSWEGV